MPAVCRPEQLNGHLQADDTGATAAASKYIAADWTEPISPIWQQVDTQLRHHAQVGRRRIDGLISNREPLDAGLEPTGSDGAVDVVTGHFDRARYECPAAAAAAAAGVKTNGWEYSTVTTEFGHGRLSDLGVVHDEYAESGVR